MPHAERNRIALQALREAGLRRTPARALVLAALDGAQRPLSQQELSALHETARLDRVTLYRTLSTLQRAGLLHRVQGTDGVWRFGSHRTRSGACGGNHIHFLCVACQQMTCLPEQALPWIEAPRGAEVYGKQLVVHGRCAACRAGAKASAR